MDLLANEHDSSSVSISLRISFWNRFVAGGVPLYGQGYSMLGDPIQWITVFYNGSSISWDIKFTLSKFIFSIGCGLLAFRISKNVTVSMVITAAAPFIGFYTHVFNHLITSV